MVWENIFSKQILNRGREYYNNGRVEEYKRTKNRHTFLVQGSRRYWVQVTYYKGNVNEMDCTCPFAMKGFRCKHMAAVMYYINNDAKIAEQRKLEELQRKQEQERLRIESIQQIQLPEDIRRLCLEPQSRDIEQEEYSFFDCKAMVKEFQWSEFEIKEAWQLVENQSVKLDEIETGYFNPQYTTKDKDDGTLVAVAKGHYYTKKTEHEIEMTLRHDQIFSAYCMYPKCGNTYSRGNQWRNKVCIHQIALFLLACRELKRKNYGDATTLDAIQLLNRFNRTKANQVMSESEIANTPTDLTLHPRLQVAGRKWMLSFKIGNQKSYVVKSIPLLVKQIQNRETVKFGKKTEWNLSAEHFTEEGKRYYEFLLKNIEEEAMRLNREGYYANAEERVSFKDAIPVFGHNLDAFREIAGNAVFEIIDSVYTGLNDSFVGFKEKLPKLKMQILKQVDKNQVFHGIQIQGTVPQFIKGEKYLYYVGEDGLYYFDKSALDGLEPYLSAAVNGTIDMKIGRNQLGAFYYKVLPWLKQYVDVDEKDASIIQQYLPPEVAFTYYLDAEKGIAYCKGEAAYGDWKLSLADVLRKDAARMERQSFQDTAREEEAAFWMQQYFPTWDPESQRYCCDDQDQIFDILSQGVSRLMEIGEVQVSDAFRRLKIQRYPKISVGVSVESSVMDLSVSSEDMSQQELLELLQSYRKHKKYYRLRDGSYVSLESESIEALDQMMSTLHVPLRDFVKGKMQIPTYRALYLDKMLETMDAAYVDRDKHFKSLIKDFKTVSDSDFEVPASLQKVLRGYQKDGYRWLRTLDTYGLGGILADDMGLGKTLQVIALLLAMRGSGVSLIVAPASLVYNWGEEIRRFAPELKVLLVTGNQVERRALLKDWKSYDVLVTSYDLLKRDIAEYEGMDFAYEVIDEAQYIKTHTTAAAKAVKVIKSRVRFALTGTPIENRLSELWSIFDYLMPGYLYGYDVFRKEIEQPIVKYKEEAASERLRKMVSPFILRRLKEQVLKDLPDKLEEVRYAKLEDEQQKLYDAQVVHMKELLAKTGDEEFQKKKLQILAELTKIRQICCNPNLCYENYMGGSAKTEACMELITSAIEGEHKILLFSQFTSMLEILERQLRSAGIHYYKITGSTPKEERLRMVNAFNGDDTPVFLISLKAGGTGLNLTGADVVIHYDPWWNMAVQNQATDRAHRIGQKKVVTVYRLIVKNSIEEKILQMQEAKKNLADTILNGENGNIGAMSKEEMLALLEG